MGDEVLSVDGEYEEYPTGLCLIRTIYGEIPFSGQGLMLQTYRANVPKTTQFVHIAVTEVKMFFGSVASEEPRKLWGSLFQTVVNTPREELKDGKVEFCVQALLAADSSAHSWSCKLAISIMCFGAPVRAMESEESPGS